MKLRILFAGLFVAVIAGTACAEEFRIGGQSFSYTVPDNFISVHKGMSEPEDIFFDTVEAHLSSSALKVPAIMIERESHAAMLRSNQPPDEYAVITHMPIVAEYFCTPEDFKNFKDSFTARNALKMNSEKQTNEDTGAALPSASKNNNALSIGPQILHESETKFTTLLPVTYQADKQEKPILLICESTLRAGKILMVSYYYPYRTKQDINTGRDKAAAFIAALDLRQTDTNP